MITYVIQDLIGNGYYDEQQARFRGMLFASRYSSFEAAETKAIEVAFEKETITTIIKVYG